MGQKIHPYGLRLGIVTDWKSRWYSDKEYAAHVAEDYKVRSYLKGELKRGAISRIDIERIGDKKVQIDVHTGRPGVVIGRGGSEAERLRSGLEKITGRIVKFNVIEVPNPELDATLLARSVADQLEGRVSFRRALKRTVSTALKAGAEGVRVQASGRLGGADMGRREWYLEGRVPLHTLRADIDYGTATAETTVGAIGIKVWVYKGDIIERGTSASRAAAEARMASGDQDRRRRKSVKSRAEAAAGGSERRIIEAGGGKRVVEAGGGKKSGKRLIEAGGGKRVVTAAEATAELEEAREAVAVAEEAAADAVVAEAVADEAVAEAVVAEAIAEVAEEAAVEAVAEAVATGDEADAKAADDAIAVAEVADEVADQAAVEAVAAEVIAEVAEQRAEEAAEVAAVELEEAVEAIEAVAEEAADASADAEDEEA